MREIDGRYDERDERVAAVVFGVGEDGDFGLEELLLFRGGGVVLVWGARHDGGWFLLRTDFTGDVRVQAREDNVAVLEFAGLAFADNHVGGFAAHGGCLFPSHGVFVLLARGARGCPDGVELERRMIGEEEDESLAHGARGSKDACGC